MIKENKVLIIGGGFAGIEAALTLSKMKIPNTQIQLISDKYHFEYTPLLYRAVTGRNPMEVCVPLDEIFKNKNVAVDVDTIIGISPEENKVIGTSGFEYDFDYVVLALGSEAIFFGIDGMKEFSFSFKSIDEALRVKSHMHTMFEKGKQTKAEDRSAYYRVVVVGGGPSGVELAGELSVYAKHFSRIHGIDENQIDITLVEGGDRLLSMLSPKLSNLALKRLKDLKVNVFLNEKVNKVDNGKVFLNNLEIETKTIIWASGIRPKEFYSTIPNIDKDKSGRVLVDSTLSIKDHNNIFVVGDGAQTMHSGMAQTAVFDGAFSARVVQSLVLGKTPPVYTPKRVGYSIPIGPHWAIFNFGGISFFGFSGWIMRKIIDLRYMMSILPFWSAVVAVKDGAQLCESCPTCSKILEKNNALEFF